jgi:hypothetical protein
MTISPQEKLKSAYELLQTDTISIETLQHIKTLLSGIHPAIDKKLEISSQFLTQLQKVQNGDLITLSAETLPEDSEEEKKRKKALIFFISSVKDLKSEMKRVEAEFSQQAKKHNSTQNQAKSWGRILAGGKGPFGLITLAAILIIGISAFATPKNTDKITATAVSPTRSALIGVTKMKAIIFNGKMIPLTEFSIGHGPDCGGGEVPHYHAPNEQTVKAMDGTIFQDPGGCGFGKVKDVKIIEVAIPPTATQ